MPQGFSCVYTSPLNAGSTPVDLVAVHDVYEDAVSAWTDPVSGAKWLQDFLPHDTQIGRILIYDYEATVDSFLSNSTQHNLQRLAESFVQELYANRHFADTCERPLIFVCHGLGGLLVKKSLLYSSTRIAPKVSHLWDQYVSTFAILFFGTPHEALFPWKWHALQHRSKEKLLTSIESGTEAASCPVNAEFLPLIRQYHLFYFWEQIPTTMGRRREYIVGPESAAPKVDDTEATGMHASHTSMIKFDTRKSQGYRTVLAALLRYCDAAPAKTTRRWKNAKQKLKVLRMDEAQELGGLGFDVHSEELFQHKDIPVQGHFDPPRPPSLTFVGREEGLEWLGSKFFAKGPQASSKGFKSCVVVGMGGSGKTEICSKYAYDARHLYSAVFTIFAATEDTIKSSFCRIGQLAGLEATASAGRHFLSQLTGLWLLIIDNADDRRTDLRSLFPSGDSVHVLVTTRCRDFCREGNQGYLELSGLEPSEALRLLLLKADIPSPWDTETIELGNAIAKTLGYLAIALIQAGNCVYRGVCRLADYLKVHSEAREVKRYRRPSIHEATEEEDIFFRDLYSTFDISLQILHQRPPTIRRDALDLLRIVCFYHTEQIPIEVFSRAFDNRQTISKDGYLSSLSARIGSSLIKRLEPPKILPSFLSNGVRREEKIRISHAIAELRSLALVSFDGKYISLHPLVHSWARDRIPAWETAVWTLLALNTLLEAVSLPPKGNSDTDGEFHRDVLPHLEICLKAHGNPITQQISTMRPTRWLISSILQPCTLLIMRDQVQNAAKCGWVFAERGLFDKARPHLELVKDVLSSALGIGHEKTTNAMLGLSAVCWGLGQLEQAISLQKTVMNTRIQALGDSHQQTLQAMNLLGRSYWLHGLHQEALDIQLVTVERMKKTMGPGHTRFEDTLAAQDNLGVTYSAWHRYEDSRDIHQQVLSAREGLLGEKHSDTLTTKANLAMALLDLGDLLQAKEYLVEVCEQRRLIFGKEHPWTLWALCYLAKVDTELGNLKEAEQMLLNGIQAGIRSLGIDHVGVLMGRGVLARVYSRQGRLDESIVLTLTILEAMEKTCGPGHPDCIYTMWQLGQLYILRGKFDSAREISKIGLDRTSQKLNHSHPLTRKLNEMVDTLSDSQRPISEYRRLVSYIQRQEASGNGVSARKWVSAGSSGEKKGNTGLPHRTSTW